MPLINVTPEPVFTSFNGGTITGALIINAAGADTAATVTELEIAQPSWGDQKVYSMNVDKDGASNADVRAVQSAQGAGAVSVDLIESANDGEVYFDTNGASFVAPRTGYTGSVFYAGVGGAKTLLVASTGLGFYGHAAVAQQTGVAVTVAAVHAALVNLGLITA